VNGVVVKRVRNGPARYCAERADLDAVIEVDYVFVSRMHPEETKVPMVEA
jgi:hypothetical protein